MLVLACVLVAPALGWAQGSEPAPNPPQNSQTPAQQLPDAPGEIKKKEENGNRAQAVAGKTKDAATAGLKRARDWDPDGSRESTSAETGRWLR